MKRFDLTVPIVRALVSKGWGGIGGEDVPDNVFLLGNVPHDQLFPHCAAVVHHGGAGTNAIGISLGCPTVVVVSRSTIIAWAMLTSYYYSHSSVTNHGGER